MRKSVEVQLLEYLQSNPAVIASGELQRLHWYNKNGSLATPRSIVRRLQELTEEGKIFKQEIAGHAHYSANPAEIPKKRLVQVRDPLTNELMVVH